MNVSEIKGLEVGSAYLVTQEMHNLLEVIFLSCSCRLFLWIRRYLSINCKLNLSIRANINFKVETEFSN